MIVIGIDPHKSTHTATALDPVTNSDVGSGRIEASVFDYQRLITWAKAWPERRWAIENAQGLGHPLGPVAAGTWRDRLGCVDDGHCPGAGALPRWWP